MLRSSQARIELLLCSPGRATVHHAAVSSFGPSLVITTVSS
jgi:hypothetical protein